MRPVRALWAYLIFVFVGGALLAPLIHNAIVSLSGGTAFHVPFRRIVDRCLLGLALAGLWPFAQAMGIRSASDFGLKPNDRSTREFLAGIGAGSLLLIVSAGIFLLVGRGSWKAATGDVWIKQIVSALGTALLVPVLEETLFRGAIFGSLRRAWNFRTALWVSSALYAILHFFSRPLDPVSIHWYSGFIVLGRMLRGFTEFQTVIPGFLSLTLLGVLFCLAFERTGRLYLSMGIHGALIFWVKLFAFAVIVQPEGNVWLWGSAKLIDGWFVFFLLAAATWMYYRNSVLPGRKNTNPDAPA